MKIDPKYSQVEANAKKKMLLLDSLHKLAALTI
jgi:hypothetical protein